MICTYKILTVKDTVRVLPSKMGLGLREAIKQSLQDQLEGTISKNIGVFLVVSGVESVGTGSILPGDGAVYYPATFRVMTYYPEMYEVVDGEVIDITEFGAFIRMGPLDGLAHISQVMDDFVSHDPKNSTFAGKETKHVLREGDNVRTRVITVSLNKFDYKIGLTMRQPGLGSHAWLAEPKANKKQARAEEKAEKPEKPERQKPEKPKKR